MRRQRREPIPCRIPVRALDEEIPCSAFSKKKETWYDRSLVFCSDSLPMAAWREGALSTPKQLGLQDGTYEAEVTLSGGSGKAILMTPCQIQVKQGEATALLVWDSPNYDYMKVGEERFEPLKEGEEPGVDTEGKSVFRIPVPFFDREMKVIADTIAMSEPHEIEYTLLFQNPLSQWRLLQSFFMQTSSPSGDGRRNTPSLRSRRGDSFWWFQREKKSRRDF